MLLEEILEVVLSDVWCIDFMGPFLPSNQSKYILVVIDYVSKSVKAAAFPTNNMKVVIKFLKMKIFTNFGTPRAIISNEESLMQ